MNILDIILLICLVPVAIYGIKKGFIAQVVAIIALVLGGWLAYTFSSALAGWFRNWFDIQGKGLDIIAFVVILVLVIVGLYLLGKLLEATIKIVMLGWLNRLLGFFFASFKFLLIAGLLIVVFDSVNNIFGLVREEYLSDSFMYSGIRKIAYTFFPYLKQLVS